MVAGIGSGAGGMNPMELIKQLSPQEVLKKLMGNENSTEQSSGTGGDMAGSIFDMVGNIAGSNGENATGDAAGGEMGLDGVANAKMLEMLGGSC